MYAIEYELISVVNEMLSSLPTIKRTSSKAKDITDTTTASNAATRVDSLHNTPLHYAAGKVTSQMADVMALLIVNGKRAKMCQK
jgi:hypothetical protein